MPTTPAVPPAVAGAAHTPRPAVMTGPLAALAALAALLNYALWHGRSQPDDFASLWGGALLVARGQADHLYDFDPQDFSAWSGPAWAQIIPELTTPFPHPYVHLPALAGALAPLTRVMSFATAVDALILASGAATVVLVAAAVRLWTGRPCPTAPAALATVALLLSTPVALGTWIGQTTALILAAVAYGLAAPHRRWWLAGPVLGVAAAIKLTPLAVIAAMIFFPTHRRTGLAAAATAGLASLAVGGVSVCTAWVAAVRRVGALVPVNPVNQSVHSVLAQARGVLADAGADVVSPTVPAAGAGQALALALAGVLAAAIAAAAWTLPAWRYPVIMTGALIVPMACASILWTHYLSVVVVPLAALAALPLRPRWRGALITASAGLCALAYPPFSAAVGAPLPAPGVVDGGGLGMLLGVLAVWLCALAGASGWPARSRHHRR